MSARRVPPVANLGLLTFYAGRSTIDPARSGVRLDRPKRGRRGGFVELWLRGRYVGVAR